MKFNELFRLLERAGCYRVRRKGRHDIWINPSIGREVPIGRHGAHEVPLREYRDAKKYLLGL